MKKLKVIVIGAGSRGMCYSSKMLEYPDKFEVVAVAEPMGYKRRQLQKMYGIPDEMCFESWEPLTELGRIADFAVIATPDRLHYAPAMKAISIGYDLLLEKPMAPTERECVEIANAAREKGVKVVVCHVLRYAPMFVAIKDIIDKGELGEIISVNHEECVGNVHQSHSFVRGNWGNSERSSTMLLQKSCHDLDILQWLLGKECKKIQSFGKLTHFKAENAPEGAPERCTDGCPHESSCPYSALKLYLNSKDDHWFRPAAAHSVERENFVPTNEDVLKALQTTQYGKCVYKCDNDVVDHQTVNMLFEDDITVTFTMNAFNEGGRYIHIMGTKGELRAAMKGNAPIEITDIMTKEKRTVDSAARDGILGGHGGGDNRIILALHDYFTEGKGKENITEADISCRNHMLVFAAERSRETGATVDVAEFMRGYGL